MQEVPLAPHQFKAVVEFNYGGIDEPYDLGMPFGEGLPGDNYAQDADLTLYWPEVKSYWEEME